jgi:penicillin amidase
VTKTLAAGDSPWCDDVTTPVHETCEQVITRALHDGVADLTQRLGPEMARWRWDAVHRAVFPAPGPRLGLATAAGAEPVDRQRRRLEHGERRNGPRRSSLHAGGGARLPPDRRSVAGQQQPFIDAVGMSGHFLSRHYDDFMTDWRDVRDRKMRMTRAEADDGALGRLLLTPAAAN